MKTMHLLVPLLLVACNPLSPMSADRAPQGQPGPMLAPPGAREEGAQEAPARTLAQAQAMEASRRPIEALKLYRQLAALPPGALSPQQVQQVTSRVEQLSFLLAVPQGGGEAGSEPTALKTSGGPASEAVIKARDLYLKAQLAEKEGKASDALAAYNQVLKTIEEKDESQLYWNAWQKVEDLSPPGAGPAARQAQADAEEAVQGGAVGVESDDGTLLAGGPDSGGRPADIGLGMARAAYLKGMDYVKARDKSLARGEFEKVLSLIRESQDPELVRAARQNLRDLETAEAPAKK